MFTTRSEILGLVLLPTCKYLHLISGKQNNLSRTIYWSTAEQLYIRTIVSPAEQFKINCIAQSFGPKKFAAATLSQLVSRLLHMTSFLSKISILMKIVGLNPQTQPGASKEGLKVEGKQILFSMYLCKEYV